MRSYLKTPVVCPPACPSFVNGDPTVNVSYLLALLAAWGGVPINACIARLEIFITVAFRVAETLIALYCEIIGSTKYSIVYPFRIPQKTPETFP